MIQSLTGVQPRATWRKKNRPTNVLYLTIYYKKKYFSEALMQHHLIYATCKEIQSHTFLIVQLKMLTEVWESLPWKFIFLK